MIVSEACTINVLLALTLTSASVINYDHMQCSNLWTYDRHSDGSKVVINYRNMFKIQATGLRLQA
jgi:hypothetical protein